MTKPLLLTSLTFIVGLSSCSEKKQEQADVPDAVVVEKVEEGESQKVEREKSILVPYATWQEGYIHQAIAVVYGEVVSTSKDQNTVTDKGEEITIYRLKVAEVFGACPELDDVAVLSSESRFDMKEGQKILLLINYYEKKPDLVTPGSAPVIVTPAQAPLLDLLRSKKLDFGEYTDEDISLIEKYYPTNDLKILRDYLRSRK